jgi:N-acylneuraminate cytidylyltransferase
MSLVAIIPARGGSRRIPRKNIRLFHGKPIIEYSIEAAKRAGFFARIYVSTDSPAISSVAYRAGADVLWRPDVLARDEVGTQAVMADALSTVVSDRLTIDPPRYACCIYATAPLMHYMHLIYGYCSLRQRRAPYCYSVDERGGDAGQWYWGETDAFIKGVSLDQAHFFSLADKRVCDINTEDDWQRAERMYAALKGDTEWQP